MITPTMDASEAATAKYLLLAKASMSLGSMLILMRGNLHIICHNYLLCGVFSADSHIASLNGARARRRAASPARSTTGAPDQPEKPADDENAQERQIALEIRN
jgi:hypothetical protein